MSAGLTDPCTALYCGHAVTLSSLPLDSWEQTWGAGCWGPGVASWCQCPVLRMGCLRTRWLFGQETQQQSGSSQRHEGAVSGREGGRAEKQVVQAEGTLISKGSHRALTPGGPLERGTCLHTAGGRHRETQLGSVTRGHADVGTALREGLAGQVRGVSKCLWAANGASMGPLGTRSGWGGTCGLATEARLADKCGNTWCLQRKAPKWACHVLP